MKSKSITKEEFIGWLGLGLLQTNTLPSIYVAITENKSMPIVSILMILTGLSCYLYRAIKQNDKLYIVGNLMGIITNVILLGIVLIRKSQM